MRSLAKYAALTCSCGGAPAARRARRPPGCAPARPRRSPPLRCPRHPPARTPQPAPTRPRYLAAAGRARPSCTPWPEVRACPAATSDAHQALVPVLFWRRLQPRLASPPPAALPRPQPQTPAHCTSRPATQACPCGQNIHKVSDVRCPQRRSRPPPPQTPPPAPGCGKSPRRPAPNAVLLQGPRRARAVLYTSFWARVVLYDLPQAAAHGICH